MLFGMVIEHKSFTWPMMLAVLLIVVGAGLAVPMEDATGSTYGLIMAGLSTLFAACKISLAARLMSDLANNGLTPLILLFYSSLASVPVLLIWFLAIEERTEVPEYIAERPGTAFIALSLASVYAFGVQLLGNTLTKITSALTMTIAGAGRQIGIIFVTGVFIEHTFSVRRGPTPPPIPPHLSHPHPARHPATQVRSRPHRHAGAVRIHPPCFPVSPAANPVGLQTARV